MKKIVFLSLLALMAVSCKFITFAETGDKRISCKGPVEIHNLDSLTGFSSTMVSGHANVVFVQGDECSVQVKANSEVFDHLAYSVDGGCLIIKTQGQIKADTYEVTVTGPVMKDISVKGAAEIKINNYSSDENLNVLVNGAAELEMDHARIPELSIEVNGAGDVDMDDLQVKSLTLNIKGAGDVSVSGTAVTAFLSVAGAGDIDASGLVCPDVKTSKSGAASIRLPK